MTVSMCPRRKRRDPPFSYTFFGIALIEALLWVAPVIEAQNANKNTFTFSLCDFIVRDKDNLKNVDQLWRTENLDDDYSESCEEPDDDEVIQRLQISLGEDAEARGRNHLSNGVSVNSNMPNGRMKRFTIITFETQQKKDGKERLAPNENKSKEEKSIVNDVVEYVTYVVLAVIFAALPRRCKGTRLLSLMSCLPLLSLHGGAHAMSLEDPNQQLVGSGMDADHKGFYLLQLFAPSKALFLILVVIMLVVYLLLCFWLSIGWLHFAKRLLFGAAPPHRKEDGNDIEAGSMKEEDNYESESEDEQEEPQTKTVSSMKPGLMIDFKFKTNVLSDALVAYSNILNISTLRSIIFDSTQDDGDDRE